MPWNKIFEEWPRAEINEQGDRTYEFLPNFEESFGNWTFNQTVPISLYNITYITWKDNSYCDTFRLSIAKSCKLEKITNESYRIQDVEKFRKTVSPDALY